MIHFTVSYEFLQLVGRRRILGILRKIGGADYYPPIRPMFYVLDQDRHQVYAGDSR
jgi:hypothetical protein